MIMEILTASGGDSVLAARYTGGDSVLVNKKEWGGLCPGGILSYTLASRHTRDVKKVKFGCTDHVSTMCNSVLFNRKLF